MSWYQAKLMKKFHLSRLLTLYSERELKDVMSYLSTSVPEKDLKDPNRVLEILSNTPRDEVCDYGINDEGFSAVLKVSVPSSINSSMGTGAIPRRVLGYKYKIIPRRSTSEDVPECWQVQESGMKGLEEFKRMQELKQFPDGQPVWLKTPFGQTITSWLICLGIYLPIETTYTTLTS